MANVQHKDILDPNIHEPKGVKTAANGTAYVANGSGSGQWIEILTPTSLGVTPSSIFTMDRDIGSNEYPGSGVLFPGSWVGSSAWGDVRVDKITGFLKVNKTGIYLVSALYSLLDSGVGIGTTTLTPTRTNTALTSFQSVFFKPISGDNIASPLVTGCIVRLTAGQGFGLWASRTSGVITDTRVQATVQMTRLSDG